MPDDVRRLVICNPHARKVSSETPAEIVTAWLHEANIEAEVVVAAGRQEARQITDQAVAAGYDQVIGAGGDGTLNSVLQGLVGTNVALGVLPLGTGNALARYLGVLPLAEALAVLQSGSSRLLDVGRINERYFAIMAGVGFSAQVAQTLAVSTKHLLGRLSYLYQGLRVKPQIGPRRFRITFDGVASRVLEADLVEATVFNLPQQMFGSVKLLSEANGNDGLLEMLLLPDAPPPSLLGQMGRRLLRPLREQVPGNATMHRFTSARIEVDPPWLWQTEGEVGGVTPVDISVVPSGLRVLYSPG